MKQEHLRRKVIRKCFSLVNSMFIMHCCCLEISFRNIAKSVISLFSILCDVGVMSVVLISVMKQMFGIKRAIAEASIQFCAFSCRLWIHKNGNVLLKVVQMIDDLKLIKNKDIQNIRKKLRIVIVLNTLVLGLLTITCVLSLNYIQKVFTAQFYHIYIDDPIWINFSAFLIYIHLVYHITAMPSLNFINFYFICLLIVKSLKNMELKLQQESTEISEEILLMYSCLTDTIFKVNEYLHTPLLISTVQNLLNSFYTIYITIFDVNTHNDTAPQSVIVLFFSFLTFNLICVSASNVSNAYENMRNKLHELLRKNKKYENMSLILKLCEEDKIEFLLMSSISINKSLVLKAFGTMITYGIMVATLGKATN